MVTQDAIDRGQPAIGGTYDRGLPTGTPAAIAPARSPAIVTALPSASGATNPPATATSPTAPGADHLLHLTALARSPSTPSASSGQPRSANPSAPAGSVAFQLSPLRHRRLAKPRLASEAGKKYRIEGSGGALQVRDRGAIGLELAPVWWTPGAVGGSC